MKPFLVVFFAVAGLALAKEASDPAAPSGVTKLEVVDLGEDVSDPESGVHESQRKRDSGYVYNRPDRFSAGHRFNAPHSGSGFRGKILSRFPNQNNRPFNRYGVPNNAPITSPSGQFSHHHHHQSANHQHQSFNNQYNNGNAGLSGQEVPSPIRNVDFVEPNPIASQNSEAFNPNAANYLPPRNQELPNIFPPGQQSFQGQNSQVHQETGRPSQQFSAQTVSDAAHFLSQNAQAISQLYGTPDTDENFAPNENFAPLHNDAFQGQTNQAQRTENRPNFLGPLPSYSSGALSSQESLEKIQSQEKDRLIVQLQTLLSQSQSQSLGNYAQNHGNYVKNENLASIGSDFPPLREPSKFNEQNHQNTMRPQNSGAANMAFGQAPFIPGTTQNPVGFLSTPQTPLAPAAGTQGPIVTGGSQPGSSSPTPSPSFPQYGGFLPGTIGGVVPSYGSGFLGTTGTAINTPIQPSGSSPTHFGLPIPQDPSGSHGQGPVSSGNVPVQPGSSQVHPVHPVSFPVHPVQPIGTPIQPVSTPLHPILPAAPPAVTAPLHPSYGVQPAVYNPLLFNKPLKAVYPIFYYPNLSYQLQKPLLPTYPWSYAPSYPQAKPAQIWK